MSKPIPPAQRTVRTNDNSIFEIVNLIATSSIGKQKKYHKKEVPLDPNSLRRNQQGLFQSQKEPVRYKMAKEEEM